MDKVDGIQMGNANGISKKEQKKYMLEIKKYCERNEECPQWAS